MEKRVVKKPGKREESAPLDALRILLHKQSVTLQPLINQVSELPVEKELEYYFVPVQ